MLEFKKFFENYDDTLEDELGIRWDDFVKIYDDNGSGQMSQDYNTFLRFGRELFKGGTYKIVPGTLTKNGASVVVKSKARSYFPGDKVVDDSVSEKVYHLNRQQLYNLLTRGWIPY